MKEAKKQDTTYPRGRPDPTGCKLQAAFEHWGQWSPAEAHTIDPQKWAFTCIWEPRGGGSFHAVNLVCDLASTRRSTCYLLSAVQTDIKAFLKLTGVVESRLHGAFCSSKKEKQDDLKLWSNRPSLFVSLLLENLQCLKALITDAS